MAFTTMQFNDLRGILFLMLMTIPSIATTNIDCNGKPFHCVNSTHFMICVDLGTGVSSTIDSFIIPCPAPTECRGTNRFECEFPAATTPLLTNEPLEITTEQTTIATVWAIESTAQFVPEIITTVPFEDSYNTVSTTTLSGSELSTPNPKFITDSTTIDVIDNVKVSSSGSHADLEVSKSTDVLNITSSTQDVFSETTVSPVITDSTVANTTENAIYFTQTDSNLNTINKTTSINLDIAITMTEQNKLPVFTSTERVSLITENKTEPDINNISEKQLVTENINAASSIQNQVEYTTESLRNDAQDNNVASITEITPDQSIIADDQNQLKMDTVKGTTVTVTNPLENVLIIEENTTTTLTDVTDENVITDVVTKQTTQISATTETLVASSIIPSHLSVPTESIILMEPNTLIENKVLVDPEKNVSSVGGETTEKTMRPISETSIEMATQGATVNNNLGNEATTIKIDVIIINDSYVLTSPPSNDLHNAIFSSTAPTIETTSIIETTTTQDTFYSVKNTSVISTSEVNATTDKVITYDNKNNITSFLQSTDSPTLTTNEKIVSTESITSETKQNEIEVHFLETNLKTLSDNLLTPVTTEKKLELKPSVIEPAAGESNINFGSNVETHSSKSDPALQQLEVPNKPDSDNNVSNLNSQNNIFSNIDLNDKQNVKSETEITTESTFTKTEINTDNNDVNTRIQLVEHNSIILQRENETFKIKTIQTTDSSNYIVSDSNIISEPSSLPVLPTEPILYLDVHTPEKATTGQVVIESTSTSDNQLDSQNNKKTDSITNTGSSILPTEATAPYYDVTDLNRKTDQLYTASENSDFADTTNKKTPDFNMDKMINEFRKIESKGHEIPKTPQNELTKRQLQERVEIDTSQKTATETIDYSPTIAADGKLVSIESTIFENEQNKIKLTVVDTTSENQLTLATTESILELNPTVTDSAISESNLFFESNVNVQLPKALLTKAIDIINIKNEPEVGFEKSNKIEPTGYETPMSPITETQAQLREIEFNTQKETKSFPAITRSIAEYDTIIKLPVTESTRNVVDYNVQTVSPDSISQLTTSFVLRNTEKFNLASKVLDSIDSTTKSNIENSPDFMNTKYYSTGDLTTRNIPTITIPGTIANNVQDHALQKILSSQNQIVIPFVNSLETTQYNSNNKLPEGFPNLQSPIKQMTTESKFVNQNDNEIPQDKTSNNKNIIANIVKNSATIDSNKLSFNKENINKPLNQETNAPILEKAVIDLSPSNTTEIQELVPDEFRAGTDNTAYSKINHEVNSETLLESANNTKTDVIIETTNNGLTLSELSSVGDLSIQNTYINKHIIIKQEGPHLKESVSKESKNAVVNEVKRTSANSNIINQTSTSYSDTRGKISNNFVLTHVGENIDQNSTVGNDTNISEAETLKTRNTLESHRIVGLVKTPFTLTSDLSKIVPIAADKASTLVNNIFDSKKDKGLNSEAVFTATQTLKSLQRVGGDNTISKVSRTEKNNGTENTHPSIVIDKKSPEARVKSLAERDVSTTSNKLSTTQIKSTSGNSQKVNHNAGEAVNLAPFDLLSSAKSGGFHEKNNKPSTEKPDDEETTATGNEGENSKINKDSSFTTSSSENMSVKTESVEGDNNGNNSNNLVQSNSKYETLTSKPTIEISARPTLVDNLKNIQPLTIVSEVSTQSILRSTSQKLSLENNTPLPATTKAVTNDFVCKFNQRGRFADKHDCRKFYICHGTPQPLEGICPVYTVFSELRKQCTKNLSHCVRNNQFQCVSEGRFSDFLNDNIYYICAKNKLSTFIRFKLRCQNGYYLNKTSVRCVLNTESSQSISSDISKSNSEQSAALKMEVKSKDLSKKKFECKEKGTFADPDNCRVYYVCKKASKSGYRRKKKKCDSDEYFHKDKKKCVDAESYECK